MPPAEERVENADAGEAAAAAPPASDRRGGETGGEASTGHARVLGADGVTDDAFSFVADGEPASPGGAVLVTVARLAAEGEALLSGRNEPVGVRLEADAEPDALAPWLDRIALVELVMKTFRDGRAFSQARALREHLRFAGQIRVSGHVLPDQLQFLRRCGVDGVVLPEGADAAAFEAAAPRYSVFYQAAMLGRVRARG